MPKAIVFDIVLDSIIANHIPKPDVVEESTTMFDMEAIDMSESDDDGDPRTRVCRERQKNGDGRPGLDDSNVSSSTSDETESTDDDEEEEEDDEDGDEVEDEATRTTDTLAGFVAEAPVVFSVMTRPTLSSPAPSPSMITTRLGIFGSFKNTSNGDIFKGIGRRSEDTGNTLTTQGHESSSTSSITVSAPAPLDPHASPQPEIYAKDEQYPPFSNPATKKLALNNTLQLQNQSSSSYNNTPIKAHGTVSSLQDTLTPISSLGDTQTVMDDEDQGRAVMTDVPAGLRKSFHSNGPVNSLSLALSSEAVPEIKLEDERPVEEPLTVTVQHFGEAYDHIDEGVFEEDDKEDKEDKEDKKETDAEPASAAPTIQILDHKSNTDLSLLRPENSTIGYMSRRLKTNLLPDELESEVSLVHEQEQSPSPKRIYLGDK
ncbi:hypothetical protein BGX28_004227 [Mortierella sp. GBA30]|nr:hypothetical protein BGX28_004227 [Mortierella sp. GBA30]